MFLCQRFEKSMELLFYSMELVLMPWICGSLLLFMRQLPKQGMLFTFSFWRNFFYNSQECIPSNFPCTPFPILSPVASISQMSFNIRFVLDLYIHGHFFSCFFGPFRVEVCSLLLAHGADPTLPNCHSKAAVDAAPTRELHDKLSCM